MDNDNKAGWIPVTERLPEEGGVFVYVLAKIVGMHYPAIARRSESSSGWVELGDGRMFSAWEITHWMPRPVPPTAAAAAGDPGREGEPAPSDGPGDGYRWVRATGPDGPGEVHEEEDEYLWCENWRRVRLSIGLVCCEPGIFRRRVTPAEAVPDDAGRRLMAGEPMTVAEMRHALGVARQEIVRLAADLAAARAEVERHRMTMEERAILISTFGPLSSLSWQDFMHAMAKYLRRTFQIPPPHGG